LVLLRKGFSCFCQLELEAGQLLGELLDCEEDLRPGGFLDGKGSGKELALVVLLPDYLLGLLCGHLL
jgi:hypothetical protein